MREGKLGDRVAIVTGGGQGMGAAIGQLLADEGAKVLIGDIDAEKARSTALSIEASGGISTWIEVDVRSQPQVEEMVCAALGEHGRADILVNCAGVLRKTRIDEITTAEWELVLDVNLKGTFLCSQAILPAMKEREYGRIVNISSVFGLVGFSRSAAYGAAKAGVAQLTADFGPRGIRINAIAPGIIDTPMTARNIREDPWFQKAMIETTPWGIGTPKDIAGVAAFLCSDDARYIAGEVINVDGGWMATRYLPPL